MKGKESFHTLLETLERLALSIAHGTSARRLVTDEPGRDTMSRTYLTEAPVASIFMLNSHLTDFKCLLPSN